MNLETMLKETIIHDIEELLMDHHASTEILGHIFESDSMNLEVVNGDVFIKSLDIKKKTILDLSKEGIHTLAQLSYADDVSLPLYKTVEKYREIKQEVNGKNFVDIEFLYDKTYKKRYIECSNREIAEDIFQTFLYDNTVFTMNISSALKNLLVLMGYYFAEKIEKYHYTIVSDMLAAGCGKFAIELRQYYLSTQ